MKLSVSKVSVARVLLSLFLLGAIIAGAALLSAAFGVMSGYDAYNVFWSSGVIGVFCLILARAVDKKTVEAVEW
ncbi:MAG: hypothetical protein AAB681_00810 [Patescibacteria group bacterium]